MAMDEKSAGETLEAGDTMEELDYEASDNIEEEQVEKEEVEAAESKEETTEEKDVKEGVAAEMEVKEDTPVEESNGAKKEDKPVKDDLKDGEGKGEDLGDKSGKRQIANSHHDCSVGRGCIKQEWNMNDNNLGGDLKTGSSSQSSKSKSSDRRGTGSSTCKPCNLAFENHRWLETHIKSGDHSHVVKVLNTHPWQDNHRQDLLKQETRLDNQDQDLPALLLLFQT